MQLTTELLFSQDVCQDLHIVVPNSVINLTSEIFRVSFYSE